MKVNKDKFHEENGVCEISPVLFYVIKPEKYFEAKNELKYPLIRDLVVDNRKAKISKTLTFYKLITKY